jgi:DNA-binding CsgD family transcriptional regulator
VPEALKELVESLQAAPDVDSVRATMLAYGQPRGWEYFAYYLLGVGEGGPELVARVSNYPAAFYERYMKQQFAKEALLFTRLRDPIVPTIWSLSDFRPGPENPPGLAEIFEMAAQNGIRAGYSLTLRYRKDRVAVISFGASQELDAERRLAVLGDTSLLLAAVYCHLRLAELLSNAGLATVQLTAQETRCLMWASEGKTAWEIGQILGIAERTAVFHLENAKSKLGVKSRQQAVKVALQLGLI